MSAGSQYTFQIDSCVLRACLALCALLCTLTACGGGTTGTGGTGSSEFSGRIYAESGQGIPNATVVIEETGDTTTSDADGNFSVESTLPSDHATILVETAAAQVTTIITDLPSGPQEVAIELKVDETKNAVTVESKRVRPRQRKPTPVPTVQVTLAPLPTESPMPTATPAVSQTPEQTAIPVETETPLPLPTEIATEIPGTPVATTPTPIATNVTVFKGKITADPAIVGKIRVGISRSGKFVTVRPDGSFAFKSVVLSEQSSLIVVIGRRIGTAALDGVTPLSRRVSLEVSLLPGAGANLKVSIDSARIVE